MLSKLHKVNNKASIKNLSVGTMMIQRSYRLQICVQHWEIKFEMLKKSDCVFGILE